MSMKSLAIKYRPTRFEEVVGQSSAIQILQQQLASGTTKNAYLFCGGAGTGKTTCARIFAREINHGQGNPIEMDAASNSGVDDVRNIITQAKTKSIDSEYKVFIIDECHSISNNGWQAFLKLIEEPPAKSIFIFCTTDPQKIPKTILSRVQRYDFQRISYAGIVNRLALIMDCEIEEQNYNGLQYEMAAVEYLAKLADGGMRDAITLMDKCLAYSEKLTVETVIKALGNVDYVEMFALLSMLQKHESVGAVSSIESIHMSGKDLKQFMKQFTDFVLDMCKYKLTQSLDYVSIPNVYEDNMKYLADNDCTSVLRMLIKLNENIKWETAPKSMIEATFLMYCEVDNDRSN